MSKIYEALRQAEVDRKNGVTPAIGATAIEEPVELREPVPIPAFSNTGRALAGAPGALSSGLQVMEPRNAHADSVLGTQSGLDLSHVPEAAWHPDLVRLPSLEERGSAVEQFRSLRSRMQEFRDLNSLKSILVSSGLPREGKSFIAANLGISLARHKNSRVLLIDGDMRRATLHEMLGCPITPGLTDFLAGNASIVDIMQRAKPVVDGEKLLPGIASLTFIPAGKEHDKAADLSGNRRFEQLIAAVSPYFDWIVVDSSPVNLVSDGVNLARSCDAVLLVARGGVTRFEVAQRAVGELKASKVLGFVLNAVKNPPIAGGYYGYDGYDKIEA